MRTWLPLLVALAVICVAFPELASANETNSGEGDLPWNTPLETLRANLTGPVATAIAVIGIAASGFGLIFGGELSDTMRKVLMVVFAAAIAIGANKIVALITGTVIPLAA